MNINTLLENVIMFLFLLVLNDVPLSNLGLPLSHGDPPASAQVQESQL